MEAELSAEELGPGVVGDEIGSCLCGLDGLKEGDCQKHIVGTKNHQKQGEVICATPKLQVINECSRV